MDFQGYIYISTIILVATPAAIVLLFVCCILICCMKPYPPDMTGIISSDVENSPQNEFELEPLQTNNQK